MQAVVSSMIRDIVCFIPLILILPKFFGIEGILFAAPISDFIAMIVAVALTLSFMRSLKIEQLKKRGEAVLKSSKQDAVIAIGREQGSSGR